MSKIKASKGAIKDVSKPEPLTQQPLTPEEQKRIQQIMMLDRQLGQLKQAKAVTVSIYDAQIEAVTVQLVRLQAEQSVVKKYEGMAAENAAKAKAAPAAEQPTP